MSVRVFLDTGALYALADRSDDDHSCVKEIWQRRDISFITHDLILTESVSLITKRLSKSAAVQIIGAVMDSSRIHVVPASAELLRRSWQRFLRFADKDWDWIDCTSFEVMDMLSLKDALSLDHHFEQAGYRLLPAE